MQRLYCYILVSLLGKVACGQRPLSFFLTAARRNNPVTRLDSIQTLANRLALDQQKAALTGPVLGLEGGYLAAPVLATGQGNTRFLLNPSKNTVDYYGYDLSLTNGGLYRGVITLEQPLLTGPRTKALEEQNRLQDLQVAQHTRLTVHQLEKSITDQYLLCRYTLDQEKVTRQLLDLIGAQAQVSQKLAGSALLYQADVQLLRIEADRLGTSLSVLEAAYRARLLDLYVLCGLSDTARTTLDTLSLPLAEDDDIHPGASTLTKIPVEPNRASGFTEPFRLDSLALTAGQQLFNLRYQPQLSLYTSAGLNSSYAPDIGERIGWQAGLKFTQVLFDGRQRRLNDRRVRTLAQGTAWQTDYFLRQNRLRKTNLRTQLLDLDAQDSAVRRQQRGYDSLLILYRRQIIGGQLSVINYLTVLRSRAALAQDLATIAYNRELLVNEYNYWKW